eukprot:scaffold2213_cov444-Prasinococcus_capsulatus_cf.AAC.24
MWRLATNEATTRTTSSWRERSSMRVRIAYRPKRRRHTCAVHARTHGPAGRWRRGAPAPCAPHSQQMAVASAAVVVVAVVPEEDTAKCRRAALGAAPRLT